MAFSNISWKNLERDVTRALLLLGAKRVVRGANFALKSVDVRCSKAKWLKVDAKYRHAHAHHKFLAEIVSKYCSKPSHQPLLVTKHHRQTGAYATMRLELAAVLLTYFVLGSRMDASSTKIVDARRRLREMLKAVDQRRKQ